MANSVPTLSRRLSCSFFSNLKFSQLSMPFCTDNLSSREDYDSEDSAANSDTDSFPSSTPQSSSSSSAAAAVDSQGSIEKLVYQRQLEQGLDAGVYKVEFAIIGGHFRVSCQGIMQIGVLFSGTEFRFTQKDWGILL